MAIPNKLETEKIIRISKLLQKILPNRELLEEILNKLQPALRPENKLLVATDNLIAFQYPNGDTYSIHLDGTIIESFDSQNSTNSFQRKTISYLNNFIFVSVDSSKSELDDYMSLPSFIERITEKKVYKQNEIVYHRIYQTKAAASLKSYSSETHSEETYVSDSRIAYKRVIDISNAEENIPKITYSKCYSYQTAPFNNLVNPRDKEDLFFVPSNENEFITSVRIINREPILQKK